MRILDHFYRGNQVITRTEDYKNTTDLKCNVKV